MHAARLFEDRFHFFGEGVRTLQRGCIGELNIQVEIPLVFGWKESGRQCIADQQRGNGDDRKQGEADPHLADQGGGDADAYLFVAVSKPRLNPPKTVCKKLFESWAGFSSNEHSAGLSDKALNAEIITAMAIVTANC